jgi:hypothetical protein
VRLPVVAFEHLLANLAAFQLLAVEHPGLSNLDVCFLEQADDQRVVRVRDIELRGHALDVADPDRIAVQVFDRDGVRRDVERFERFRDHHHALTGGEGVADGV